MGPFVDEGFMDKVASTNIHTQAHENRYMSYNQVLNTCSGSDLLPAALGHETILFSLIVEVIVQS